MTVIHTQRAGEAAAAPSLSPTALQPDREGEPAEVLFPEAKRRERRRRLIVAVVLIAVVGAAIGLVNSFGRSSKAAPPLSLATAGAPAVNARAFAHEGLLAFTSGRGLYVLNGSTGVLRQVGTARTGAEEPTFSHDDRWLAYVAAGEETKTDFGEEAPYAPFTGPLVISSADGSGAKRITNIGPISSLAWSPESDRLLVVSGSTPYYGNAVWLVSPTGQSRRLYSGESVFGAVWSPDGSEVAIGIQHLHGEGPTMLETLSASGGAARVWSQPTATDEQWLIPIGWWRNQGIGLWAGGNGSTPDGDGSLDGADLMIASAPAAPFRSLGRTPPIAMTPAVASKIGWLAVDQGGDREAWAKKSIETCAPGGGRCSSILEPASETAFDPVWSRDGTELAFVEAPTNENSTFAPNKIGAWYASGQLEVLAAGKTQGIPVPHTLGATAPQWSPSGHGFLYVDNDALYLVRNAGDSPVRIAGPLLPAAQWTSTYYGGIDWRFMFAWAAQ